MDTAQLLAMLAGAGTIIGGLATTIFRLQNTRISALEAENATLRSEAKAAVAAKDAEITTLRQMAADLAKERAGQDAQRRQQP